MFLKQKVGLQISPFRAVLLFIIGTLDCALFGGAVFGWPQLVYTLKKEGIFGDLCESATSSNGTRGNHSVNPYVNDHFDTFEDGNITSEFPVVEGGFDSTILAVENTGDRGCPAQDERYSLIFTFTVFMYGSPGVFVGLLLHYGGIVLTRFISGVLVGISFLCLSAATHESPNWLWPAMLLLALSGNAIRMSVLQLGDLYPRHRSTAIAFLSGVYSFGTSLFLLFQVMGDAGISRQTVCYLLSAVGFFSALASFLAPCHHIPFADEKTSRGGHLEGRMEKPLSKSMKTTSYMLYIYFNIIGLFALNAYQGTYNVWVTASTSSSADVRLLSNMFSGTSLFSAIIGPMGGCLTDCLIRKAQKGDHPPDILYLKKIRANFLPIFLTSIFMTSMYGCLFFKSFAVVVVSLVCQTVFRPNVIATPIAFLRIRFPGDHFNRLVGIGSTASSIMQLLQYPYFRLLQQNYYLTHGLVMALILLSFAFPFKMLCKRTHGSISIQSPVPSESLRLVSKPEDAQIVTTVQS